MLGTVSISSKRQVTIPAVIYKNLGLEKGQKLIVFTEKNKIVMEPAEFLIEKLAGSIIIPKRFRGKSLEKIIQEAKKSYFSK
ncbi:MAG: AbrB/MazE/SpoVT family DNA-binding domain-containing protein [Microgenomates group bacterium]